MADFLSATMTGQLKVIVRFDQFPQIAHDRIFIVMRDVEQSLEAAVIASEPKGKTGQLQALTGGRVYDHNDRIAAVVGVNTKLPNIVRKAAALEFGSRGTAIQVRQHPMRLDHFWSTRVTERLVMSPKDTASYSRTPHITAVRYLRDPLAAAQTQALVAIQAAVDAAVAESNA